LWKAKVTEKSVAFRWVPRVSPVLAYPGMFRVIRTDLSFFSFVSLPVYRILVTPHP
jgi:hypothetical protein